MLGNYLCSLKNPGESRYRRDNRNTPAERSDHVAQFPDNTLPRQDDPRREVSLIPKRYGL